MLLRCVFCGRRLILRNAVASEPRVVERAPRVEHCLEIAVDVLGVRVVHKQDCGSCREF